MICWTRYFCGATRRTLRPRWRGNTNCRAAADVDDFPRPRGHEDHSTETAHVLHLRNRGRIDPVAEDFRDPICGGFVHEFQHGGRGVVSLRHAFEEFSSRTSQPMASPTSRAIRLPPAPASREMVKYGPMPAGFPLLGAGTALSRPFLHTQPPLHLPLRGVDNAGVPLHRGQPFDGTKEFRITVFSRP